jgi:hypothetical protein
MNRCHSWKLCFSSLNILIELGNSQNKLPHPFRKGSLPNRKSTGQKEVNKKIHTTYSDLYRKSFPNLDSPKNPPQYKQISLKSSGKVLAQSND